MDTFAKGGKKFKDKIFDSRKQSAPPMFLKNREDWKI